MARVLIVDDDPGTLEGFQGVLHDAGYDVTGADCAEQGLTAFRRTRPDVVLADLRLPDLSGLDLLRRVRRESGEVRFVVVTGFGSCASAVEAMRLGATDYVEKPLIGDDLIGTVQRALAGAPRLGRLAEDVLLDAPDASRWPDARSERAPSCSNAAVARALLVIDAEYRDPQLSLSTISSRVGLTLWHLARQIRAATGTTFLGYLHQRRVAEARRLLRGSDKSVKEIAFLVGYADTRRLDTHFKRAERLTPIRFRQRVRRLPDLN